VPDGTLRVKVGRSDITLELVPAVAMRVVRSLRERAREDTPKLPTGIDALDQLLWGLWPQQLLVVAARPGDGKTSLVLQIARHLAEVGKSVVFVSYEMTTDELTSRLFSSWARLDLRRMRGDGYDEAFLEERVSMFQAAASEWPLQIVDDLPRDWLHLKRFLDLLDPVPDVVIVDHLQEVSAQGFRNEWSAYTEYCAEIKAIAKRTGTSMVLCSQLSRPDKGERSPRPMLQDLKGTGAIEEKADTVVFLWPHDHATDRVKLLIEKQRHGPTGEVDVVFRKETFRFL
jgi:replicative DNA helicase